jgi:hypothetical protein
MKIKTELVQACNLQPGDLFSYAGPEYWDWATDEKHGSIGERVYIRTETPAIRAPDADAYIYRITIER